DRRGNAIPDDAITVDQECLGYAGDTEVDAGAPALVRTSRSIRVAKVSKKAARRVRLVLPRNADERHAEIRAQLLEERMLGTARQTPGGEEVDRDQFSFEG